MGVYKTHAQEYLVSTPEQSLEWDNPSVSSEGGAQGVDPVLAYARKFAQQFLDSDEDQEFQAYGNTSGDQNDYDFDPDQDEDLDPNMYKDTYSYDLPEDEVLPPFVLKEISFFPKKERMHHHKRVAYGAKSKIEKSMDNQRKQRLSFTQTLKKSLLNCRAQPTVDWAYRNGLPAHIFRENLQSVRQKYGARTVNLLIPLRIAYNLEVIRKQRVPKVPKNYFLGLTTTMRYARVVLACEVKTFIPHSCPRRSRSDKSASRTKFSVPKGTAFSKRKHR